jgi:hypothetical protein
VLSKAEAASVVKVDADSAADFIADVTVPDSPSADTPASSLLNRLNTDAEIELWTFDRSTKGEDVAMDLDWERMEEEGEEAARRA